MTFSTCTARTVRKAPGLRESRIWEVGGALGGLLSNMGCDVQRHGVGTSQFVFGPPSKYPPRHFLSRTSIPLMGNGGGDRMGDPAGLFPDVLQHTGTCSKPFAKGDTAKQIGRYCSRCLRWGIATINLGIAVALLFHPALVLVELLCWLITKGAFCCSRGGEDRGDGHRTKKEACH